MTFGPAAADSEAAGLFAAAVSDASLEAADSAGFGALPV